MSGHEWSTIKRNERPPTRSAASSSPSSRRRSSSRRRRRARPGRQPLPPERDREGEVLLDAEGHDRARDRAQGPGHRCRRRPSRRSSTRGYGPEGVADARRGADRQPQPHRVRRAPSLLQARWQPRHDRRGRLALRAPGRRARRGGLDRRGRPRARRGRRGRGRRRAGRLRLPGLVRAEALSAVREGDQAARIEILQSAAS